MARDYQVYTLLDPRDSRIRYVGCTSQDLSLRVSQHVYGASSGRDRSRRAAWLMELLEAGLQPGVSSIETIDEKHWEAAEQKWISYYRESGCDLTNSTDGGSGSRGVVFSDAHRKAIGERMRILHTGLVRSEESRARMSAAQRAIPKETRDRMNEINRARLADPKVRAAIAAGLRGRKLPPEQVEKLRTRPISEETRKKLREAWERRPDELKQKQGDWARGIKRSEETRKRMSEAAKRRWERERMKKDEAA